MRAAAVSILVILLGVLEGSAAADALLVGKVTDLLGTPVPNVRVHVVSKGDHQIVTTNQDGEYRVVVDGNRTLSVVIGAGEFHTFRGGTIKDGSTLRLDFELEVSDGEIIRIVDSKPPTVPPKLPAGVPNVTPPYSTEAMERDAWAKAWLLLDIDETGRVRRVKLVKRPGFDLDNIAVQEAMKLRFVPALDENNKPMRTTMYWAMEWPSYAWLMVHQGSTKRMPTESYAIDPFSGNFGGMGEPTGDYSGIIPQAQGDNSLAHVPCAGSGPLNLDLRYTAYRDCSQPNVRKVPHLPWLDGTKPVPPDPAEIALKAEAPVHLSRASYIPQIATSVVSLGLIAATVVTFVKFDKYASRMAHYSMLAPQEIDRDQLISDARNRDRYARWSLISVSAATAATAFSLSLWFRHQRRSDFSVQPEDGGGASVWMNGSF
jgi:hypothetical protein